VNYGKILYQNLTKNKLRKVKCIYVGSNIFSDSFCFVSIPNDMIYLLTAIGLTTGGTSTVLIYTQTIHRTTQLTTLVGRLSGIRTQSGQNKINYEITA
jgi:heme O synthase-like polyprenyltransferase